MVGTRSGRIAALAAVAVLALTASACGGGGSDNGGGGGGSGSAAKKVGVILPDATTSPRWEANDRPSLKKAFDAAGIESDIQNAGGDKAKFGTICDGMINSGVSVLMIVNLDSDSGAACLSIDSIDQTSGVAVEQQAAAAGIQVIDYDRLTLGGGASYYVSFDNVKVGELMGQGLITCLDKMGKKSANIVYINGDPTDNNAALFKSGYAKALKPKLDSGAYKLVGDQTGLWDATKAGTANDTMAGGIIARLAANGLAGKVPVTGQDASVEGLQAILKGTQCMTVYKDTNLEAKAASDLAIALIKGDQAKADSLATGAVKDTVTGKDVRSALATPKAIFQDGVKTVVADGFQPKSKVCAGSYAALCTKYGVQ